MAPFDMMPPAPWPPSTDQAAAIVKQHRFFSKFLRRHPDQTLGQQSIYKLPPNMRDLSPEAYDPRVVSIGPYHHGEDQLELMEEHKHRARLHFLKRANGATRLEDLVSHFREGSFLRRLMGCYAGPLEGEWDEQTFPHLMVLDGCFVLELLLTAAGDCPPVDGCCYAADDPIFVPDAARHGVIQYVKTDLLLLENQLPLVVLRKLADIIGLMELNINMLVRRFYGFTDHQKQEQPEKEPLGLHILDVYRRARLQTGDYCGWTVPTSASQLDRLGINLRKNPGPALHLSSFKDVTFSKHKGRKIVGSIYDHFLDPIFRSQVTQSIANSASRLGRRLPHYRLPFSRWSPEWLLSASVILVAHKILTWFFRAAFFWYLPMWIVTAKLSLPALLISEATEALLLNLMAFEWLHLGSGARDMGVTCYVFLMSSLIRTKKDVALLRERGVVVCLPERRDKDVVVMFRGIARGVLLGDAVGPANQEMEVLCRRKPNRLKAQWYEYYGADLKTWVIVLLTIYTLFFTVMSAVMKVLEYNLHARRFSQPCRP